MGKKRKTRQQKIFARMRHLQKQQEKKTLLPIVNTAPEKFRFTASPAFSVPTVTGYSYAYVTKELRRTTLISLGIIGSEILLFFLLVKHILILPILSY